MQSAPMKIYAEYPRLLSLYGAGHQQRVKAIYNGIRLYLDNDVEFTESPAEADIIIIDHPCKEKQKNALAWEHAPRVVIHNETFSTERAYDGMGDINIFPISESGSGIRKIRSGGVLMYGFQYAPVDFNYLLSQNIGAGDGIFLMNSVASDSYDHNRFIYSALLSCGLQENVVYPSERLDVNRNIELLSKCKMAISSGGLSSQELACYGIQQAIFPIGEQQRITAEYIQDNGGGMIFDRGNAKHIIEKLYNNPLIKNKMHNIGTMALSMVLSMGSDAAIKIIEQMQGENYVDDSRNIH